MIGDITPIVIGLKTVTLLLGGLITYLASRAAISVRSSGLAYLAAGFAVITAGTIVAGVADQLFGLRTGIALVVENAVSAVGFAVVAYSIYVTRRGDSRIR